MYFRKEHEQIPISAPCRGAGQLAQLVTFVFPLLSQKNGGAGKTKEKNFLKNGGASKTRNA
jgi:hypothetical protein